MAPLVIHHFSHESHPLKPVESDQVFRCNGCKTLGSGKRFRCNGCDFDLHDYCGTCPQLLTSFMHRHSLTLVMRRPQPARWCDICRDPVEGLFYTCEECGFDVHPVCTKLPQKLNHTLHKIHPLTLEPSSTPSFCGLCGNYCAGWRYRCFICNFDIHLECVLAPMVSCPQHRQTSQRGIPMLGLQQVPFQAPPQYYGFQYYSPGYPYPGPGYNYAYHHYDPYMYPQQNFGQAQVGASNDNGPSRLGKYMFSLVQQLVVGVCSNMIFGMDLTSFMG